MKKMYGTTLLALLVAGALQAQGSSGAAVEMADAMRSNGMIYVVVAGVVTIVAGLALYLLRLDRKLSRLEKEAGC